MRKFLNISLWMIILSLNVSGDSGQAIYLRTCSACHGPEGEPFAPVFPPLSGSEWLKGEPDRAIKIVLGGLAGEITVKGKTYNGLMPAQGELLNDEEIASLLTYLRSSWGLREEAVSVEKVKAIRSNFKVKSGEGNLAEDILKEHPVADSSLLQDIRYRGHRGDKGRPIWDPSQNVKRLKELLSDFEAFVPNSGKEGQLIEKHRPYCYIEMKAKFTAAKSGKYVFKAKPGRYITFKMADQDKIISSGMMIEVNLEKGVHDLTIINWGHKWQGMGLYFGVRVPGEKDFINLSMGKDPNYLKVSETKTAYYKNLMKGTGPRSLLAAFPNELALVFDEEKCDISMLSCGNTIDVNTHYVGRGIGAALMEGRSVVYFHPEKSERRYIGRQLGEQLAPTFMYERDGFIVDDKFTPVEPYSLKRKLTISVKRGVNSKARFLLANGFDFKKEGNVVHINASWKITFDKDPVLEVIKGRSVLYLPIGKTGAKATVYNLEYIYNDEQG